MAAAAQRLELSAVISVDPHGGVHVDAVRDGDGLVRTRPARFDQV
jgi:hypothetical protein